MASYRDRLEQEGSRFRLPPDALERFHRRRAQRQRNRRIASGLVALAITGGGTWFAFSALEGEPQLRPARVAEIAKLDVEPAAIAAGGGSVWVATEDGLLRVEPDTGATTDVPLPGRLGQPISVQVAEGSVWVQTASIGQEFSVAPGHPRITPAAVVSIDPSSGRVASTFDLPANVVIPVSVGGGAVWSASFGGLVSQRDIDDGRVTGMARAQPSPEEISYGEGALWVLSPGGIQRIDPELLSVTAEAGVGGGRELAVGAGGVWVLDEEAPSVLHLDPGSGTVLEVIPLTGGPDRITAGSAGVWVLDRAGGVVSQVEDGEVVQAADVSAAVEVTQGDGRVWVALADGTILRVGG